MFPELPRNVRLMVVRDYDPFGARAHARNYLTGALFRAPATEDVVAGMRRVPQNAVHESGIAGAPHDLVTDAARELEPLIAKITDHL